MPHSSDERSTDLHRVGLKATLPRLKVLEILRQGPRRHLSAEDVHRALLQTHADVGLATVYRVLGQLEQAGILARRQFDAGPAVYELDEGFVLSLTEPTNATLGRAQGTGTIRNDDAAPTFAIDDRQVPEGNIGSAEVAFTVTLTGATEVEARVTVGTVDGTATAGTDYLATAATLIFAPGQTAQPIPAVTCRSAVKVPVTVSLPVDADSQGKSAPLNPPLAACALACSRRIKR